MIFEFVSLQVKRIASVCGGGILPQSRRRDAAATLGRGSVNGRLFVGGKAGGRLPLATLSVEPLYRSLSVSEA